MAIAYYAENISFPKIKKREISKWIKDVASTYHKRVGEITYIFCPDDEILRINQQYLNHNYYTDIITFDYSENDLISGDLFISLDTVKSNSEKYRVDYPQELYRVMIHGILHLCGLKDKTPEEEKTMRIMEEQALKILNLEI